MRIYRLRGNKIAGGKVNGVLRTVGVFMSEKETVRGLED
jgi:hypothetical protein